ncbi:MAG: hypothetical protein ABI488_03620 [Polyangiaceae bacterium]
MKRKALMFALALGAVGGFASGLYGCHHHGERRQAFEDHIADVCTRAAERSHGHPSDAENLP